MRAGLAPLAGTSLGTRADQVGRVQVGRVQVGRVQVGRVQVVSGQTGQGRAPAGAEGELGADRASHQVAVRVAVRVVSQAASLVVLVVRLAASQDTNQRHKTKA